MMQVTVTKAELEAGGKPCAACKTPLPATPYYSIRCPKCGQLHQTPPAPAGAAVVGQA